MTLSRASGDRGDAMVVCHFPIPHICPTESRMARARIIAGYGNTKAIRTDQSAWNFPVRVNKRIGPVMRTVDMMVTADASRVH